MVQLLTLVSTTTVTLEIPVAHGTATWAVLCFTNTQYSTYTVHIQYTVQYIYGTHTVQYIYGTAAQVSSTRFQSFQKMIVFILQLKNEQSCLRN